MRGASTIIIGFVKSQGDEAICSLGRESKVDLLLLIYEIATAHKILLKLMLIHAPRNDVLKLSFLPSLRGAGTIIIGFVKSQGDEAICSLRRESKVDLLLPIYEIATAHEILLRLMLIHAPRNDVLKLSFLSSLRGACTIIIGFVRIIRRRACPPQAEQSAH